MKNAPTHEDRAGAEERDKYPQGIGAERIPDPFTGTDPKHLRGSTIEAVQFLQAWAEKGPWVLTAIPPDGGRTATATFAPETAQELFAWIEERQGRQNIYFMVNPGLRPLTSKAAKTDIRGMTALHVDVDPRAGEDPTKERERAEKLLRAYDPPPTVIIDSGGGFQGFWLLDNEQPTGGSVERAEELEAYNIQIAHQLQADNCHNIDRIMRLPGTINLPGEKKRKKGRVSALARLVVADWSCIYPLSAFTAAPRVQAPGERATGGRSAKISGNLPRLESLDELPPEVSNRTKALIVNGSDPDDPQKYPSRSECLFAVLCELVRAGCSDDQMAAVILDPDYGISGHVLAQPRPQNYAARQIQRAREEAVDPELEELNARHVVIETMGNSGKCRIMERLTTPDGRGLVAFQSFVDFGNRYDHRRKLVGTNKSGEDVYMPLGKWWKQHPNRRQHRALAFLPGGAEVLEGDQLNLWNGFSVQPAPGDWSLMQTHIREVLAAGDDASAEYILKWAAYAVQQPGAPAETALVFRGDLGTGKGAFGRVMMQLFGQHGLRTQGAAVLDSRFNAHLRDCVLLFADEVDWDHRRSSAQLKGMVTEPNLFIEPKGVDATNQPNYLHIIIASNNDWVIPAAPGERRFAAFRVADHRKGDKAYFDALFEQMKNGGLAAMLHDLLAMDLTGWHPRSSIPQTLELSDQKLAGLNGADAIVREMLMVGIAPGAMEASQNAGLALMIPPLIRWALDNRIVTENPGTQRMAAALKRMGIERKRLTFSGMGQERAWPLPPLAEAREAWASNLGVQVAWPEDGDWSTFPD